MELIDRLKEVLKEEFNICSDEELLEAVQSMPELDLWPDGIHSRCLMVSRES